ncbi:MAG TPA: hypothetical protein VJ576_18745 [Rhodocyclaceae bacterium]|nr:hypothetical protein [Rhodocyclaceae bacterium]
MKKSVIQAIRERQLLHIQGGKRRCLAVAPKILRYTLTGYTARLCCQAGWPVEEETHPPVLDLGSIKEMTALDIAFGPRPQGGLRSGGFQALEAVIQQPGIRGRRTESVQQLKGGLVSWVFGPTS